VNLRESIGIALGGIRANKLRSFLTLLGIIIGVASVIAVVSFV
jgi:putative ABC transport system permease protein